MHLPKTAVSRQQSQDITNLLETSMDSPMRQPTESKREEQKLELHPKEKRHYRISQVKDTADWNSLSGWDGGTLARSPKIPVESTPTTSPQGRTRSNLQVDKQPILTLKALEQNEQYITYSSTSISPGQMTGQPRKLVKRTNQPSNSLRSSATSSEQRKPLPTPDPSTMTLADFVRTSLGFTPGETARFQNRAKANLLKNPRRSLASEQSEKLESTDFEKYHIIREPSISGLSSLKTSIMNSKESYFGVNSTGAWTHRKPSSIKKEVIQGSYLEQKRLLKDTKKILANLSRVRVMNMLGTSTANDNAYLAENSKNKPRFSLNLRQASATSSVRSPVAVQSQECSQIGQPSAMSPMLEYRPNFSPTSPKDSNKAAFYKLMDDTGSPSSPNQNTGFLSLAPDKVQEVLRSQLRSLNSMRLKYGTHIGGLIKSQTPAPVNRSFEIEKELSAQKKVALQEWRQNFGKSGPPSQNLRSEAGQDVPVSNRDEFKRRSDIEGLMWQLDTLGKKISHRKLRNERSQPTQASFAATRPNSPQVRELVEQVTLEKKIMTPFQKGAGVERFRHVRSVSMGFVSAPKSQPVVSIKNSSGRLLGRYQLKKTFVPM